MKSNRRILPKPQFKLQNILARLQKEPILYTEFLELLEKEKIVLLRLHKRLFVENGKKNK